VGQIDRHLIAAEKSNLDHIAATLGLKDMSQSVLVRKICTLSGHHRTRKALFEYDKLIRSIYTLRYLRDPQLQRDVHRSESRIKSYHQLHSTRRKRTAAPPSQLANVLLERRGSSASIFKFRQVGN
jgi:TnpA family transposase